MTVWRYLLFSTGCTESPCNCLHYRPNLRSQKSCLDPAVQVWGFFWATLFLSFSICDFPPFENASFPWISLSLHISTSITFPLLGLFLLRPCPFPIPSHLFYIFLCLPPIHKALAISHLLCLILSTVQKTCWTERAGGHLTNITSADENEVLWKLAQRQKETQFWTGGTYQKASLPWPEMKTNISWKNSMTQLIKKNLL